MADIASAARRTAAKAGLRGYVDHENNISVSITPQDTECYLGTPDDRSAGALDEHNRTARLTRIEALD